MDHSKTQRVKRRAPAIPIKDVNTIRLLRQNLKGTPRDLLLFDLITQTGLRVKYLIALKVKDLIGINIGQELPLIHGGNHTSAPIMNQTIHLTLQSYLDKAHLQKDDYLFKSKKRPDPLSLTSVSHLVRKWFSDSNLKGFSGTSSLRKTWEFHNGNNDRTGTNWDIPEKSKAVLNPVDTGTLQDAVYRELKKAILSGHIQPGERLFTEKVAQQTMVSETPAREALTKLEAGGFISKEARKGYIVKELSSKDLREILKIRLVLETMATRDAMGRISKTEISRLEDILHQHEQAIKDNDIEKYSFFNKKFHHTIYSAADLPTLYRIISLLWDRMSPYLNLLIRECEDYNPSFALECHRGMLEGIKHNDSNETCKWIEVDLNRATKTLTVWFDRKKTE